MAKGGVTEAQAPSYPAARNPGVKVSGTEGPGPGTVRHGSENAQLQGLLNLGAVNRERLDCALDLFSRKYHIISINYTSNSISYLGLVSDRNVIYAPE